MIIFSHLNIKIQVLTYKKQHILKNSLTYVSSFNKNVTVQNCFMHTSNAFMECYILLQTNPKIKLPLEIEKEATAIVDYIARCFDKGWTLTQAIQNSEFNLGYKIHPESFFFALNDVVDYMKIQRERFVKFDDLKVLDHAINNENVYSITFNDDRERVYHIYHRIFEMAPVQPNDFALLKHAQVAQAAIDGALPPKGPIVKNVSENGFHKISVPKLETSSSDASDTSSTSSDSFDNNNLTILLYTISVFVIINSVAWFVRKYYPESIAKSTETTNDDILNSVNEPTIYSKFSGAIAIIIIPLFIVILYNFRYYYFYKLKQKYKNLIS